MNIRETLRSVAVMVALAVIGLSLLYFADGVLYGATLARYILCAVGFFGGRLALMAVGAYEW